MPQHQSLRGLNEHICVSIGLLPLPLALTELSAHLHDWEGAVTHKNGAAQRLLSKLEQLPGSSHGGGHDGNS
jgi:hypothetical protein